MDLIVKGSKIVDTETGEIVGSTIPKFQGWNYDKYLEEFNSNKEIRFLEPMTAQEIVGDKLQQVINSTPLIAEHKFDGHRALIYLTSKGNRLFSRRVSKQTNWYAENSDQMPHIRDLRVPNELYGTVLDGEVVLPIEGCTCRHVQSVTGALPDTAINKQLEVGFARINVFDILYYKGVNIQNMPLWKRKIYLLKVLETIDSKYLQMCPIFATGDVLDNIKDRLSKYNKCSNILEYVNEVDSIDELFSKFMGLGLEGLILKDIDGIYEQKRSSAFIKMKAHETFDVVIMGYEEPTAVVDLSERKTKEEDWLYWENIDGDVYYRGIPKGHNKSEYHPVTKFYAMDWIGAIVFGVWKDGKLVEVGRTSGMDEATRECISENKKEFLGKVIEVEAQCIIDKKIGSLQHPRFIRIREDKNSESCTFEAHIREDIK